MADRRAEGRGAVLQGPYRLPAPSAVPWEAASGTGHGGAGLTDAKNQQEKAELWSLGRLLGHQVERPGSP